MSQFFKISLNKYVFHNKHTRYPKILINSSLRDSFRKIMSHMDWPIVLTLLTLSSKAIMANPNPKHIGF